MNTRFETPSRPDYHQATIHLYECHPEYQNSAEGIGGISSFPLHLLRQATLLTGIAVVGTLPVSAFEVPHPIEGTFVFPSVLDVETEDEYSRIRNEIAASGIPMLSDDEVRAEIRET